MFLRLPFEGGDDRVLFYPDELDIFIDEVLAGG